MIGNNHEKDIISLLGKLKKNNRVNMSNDLVDLWTEVRNWSLRPVCRLRVASGQTWSSSLKKQLRSGLNVERSLV